MGKYPKQLNIFCKFCNSITLHTLRFSASQAPFYTCNICSNRIPASGVKVVSVAGSKALPAPKDVTAPEVFLDVPAVIDFNNDHWKQKKADERRLKRAKKRAEVCGCNSCKAVYRSLKREFDRKYN